VHGGAAEEWIAADSEAGSEFDFAHHRFAIRHQCQGAVETLDLAAGDVDPVKLALESAGVGGKFDWNKWENKLKLAYDKIDWDQINDQLGKAVTIIRLDSLQKVYTIAAEHLDKVQQELTENNLTGIPDTDVTLTEVKNKKVQLQKLSNNLRAIRSKKIIHL